MGPYLDSIKEKTWNSIGVSNQSDVGPSVHWGPKRGGRLTVSPPANIEITVTKRGDVDHAGARAFGEDSLPAVIP